MGRVGAVVYICGKLCPASLLARHMWFEALEDACADAEHSGEAEPSLFRSTLHAWVFVYVQCSKHSNAEQGNELPNVSTLTCGGDCFFCCYEATRPTCCACRKPHEHHAVGGPGATCTHLLIKTARDSVAVSRSENKLSRTWSGGLP